MEAEQQSALFIDCHFGILAGDFILQELIENNPEIIE